MLFVSEVIVTSPEFLRHGSRDVNVLHNFVMSLFPMSDSASPREESNILWAVHPQVDPSRLVLVIQSSISPSLTHVKSDLADSLTLSVERAQSLPDQGHFKITLNSHAGVMKYGVEQWLVKAGSARGLKFNISFVSEPSTVDYVRGATRVPFAATTVYGAYEVLEPLGAAQARLEGIGKAKSYGMGLLLVK